MEQTDQLMSFSMDKITFKGLINQLCGLTLNNGLFKSNKTDIVS